MDNKPCGTHPRGEGRRDSFQSVRSGFESPRGFPENLEKFYRCHCCQNGEDLCTEPIYHENACYWCWEGLDAEYEHGPFEVMMKAAHILGRKPKRTPPLFDIGMAFKRVS